MRLFGKWKEPPLSATGFDGITPIFAFMFIEAAYLTSAAPLSQHTPMANFKMVSLMLRATAKDADIPLLQHLSKRGNPKADIAGVVIISLIIVLLVVLEIWWCKAKGPCSKKYRSRKLAISEPFNPIMLDGSNRRLSREAVVGRTI